MKVCEGVYCTSFSLSLLNENYSHAYLMYVLVCARGYIGGRGRVL